MKENLKAMKFGIIASITFLIISGIGGYFLLKATRSSTNLGSDAAPNDLYVDSAETLKATKRNSLVDKVINPEIDLKITTATHNGNFGGYKAMYDWIQVNGCAGYHVCDGGEISLFLQNGGIKPGYDVRYSLFSMNDGTSPYMFDCSGWGASTTTHKGPIFRSSGSNNEPNSSTCDVARYVACCKNK